MGSFSAVSIDTRYKAEGPFTLSGIAAKSGWHRAYVERVIGTVRRECLDHMIVFSERSLGIPGVLSSESHAFGSGEGQFRLRRLHRPQNVEKHRIRVAGRRVNSIIADRSSFTVRTGTSEVHAGRRTKRRRGHHSWAPG